MAILSTGIDLLSINSNDKVKYVIFDETSKEDMLSYLAEGCYMICRYHTTGYNATYWVPLVYVMNAHQEGNQIVEFITTLSDGSLMKLQYNAMTDTWSQL